MKQQQTVVILLLTQLTPLRVNWTSLWNKQPT